MKRKILKFLILILVAAMGAAVSSCGSKKKVYKSFYDAQFESLKKGTHGNDKNGKDHKEVSKERKRIIQEAKGWLGTPYAYGRADKGVACDCSGMVMCVYEKVTGIKLPRNSAKQSEFCKSLKKKDVLPGDLCFFATGKDPDRISHVGIMMDDTNFIHASSTKGVVVSDIAQPYWVRTFKGFGRVPD